MSDLKEKILFDSGVQNKVDRKVDITQLQRGSPQSAVDEVFRPRRINRQHNSNPGR
jgi:hypothetical protein